MGAGGATSFAASPSVHQKSATHLPGLSTWLDDAWFEAGEKQRRDHMDNFDPHKWRSECDEELGAFAGRVVASAQVPRSNLLGSKPLGSKPSAPLLKPLAPLTPRGPDVRAEIWEVIYTTMHPITHAVCRGDMLGVLTVRAECADRAARESKRIHMEMGEAFAGRARDWRAIRQSRMAQLGNVEWEIAGTGQQFSLAKDGELVCLSSQPRKTIHATKAKAASGLLPRLQARTRNHLLPFLAVASASQEQEGTGSRGFNPGRSERIHEAIWRNLRKREQHA